MLKKAMIIASFLPGIAFADTTTVITPQANYVITQTPATTYVVGTGSGMPIAVTPSSQPHTYITPTGTYMSIPNGNTTTVIQVSGCCK